MIARLSLVWLAAGCVPMLPEVDEPCAEWEEPGLYRFKVDAAGKTRKAWLYVPPNEGPRDLVFMLHGGGSNARKVDNVTEHIALARQRGFVAVFPQGVGFLEWHAWNTGGDNGTDAEDLAYLDALADALDQRVCGDRLLATGFSQGAMAAHRWACASDRVDGVVPASGPLFSSVCEGRPVPVRHYHGLADTVVPSAGGVGENGTDFPSVMETMARWRERNQCVGEEPVIEQRGRVVCRSWDCAAPTEACLIQDWAHRWPGGRNASALDGVNATTDGWNFFNANATPAP